MELKAEAGKTVERSPECGRGLGLFSQQWLTPRQRVKGSCQLGLGALGGMSSEEKCINHPRGNVIKLAPKREEFVTEDDSAGITENRPGFVQSLNGLGFIHRTILAHQERRHHG